MNHKERLRAAIDGRPVDRPPVSLWRHNFLREWSADELADETLTLYLNYDWDLIKLNPRWSYLPEVWGNRYERPTEQRYQRLVHQVIEQPSDLDRIEPGAVDHPSLVEQLDAIEAVVEAVGDEVDIIHTVFSPLAVLGLLAGGVGEPLVSMLEANPDGADLALAAVTTTVAAHIDSALDRGAAGVFYAPLPWTSLDNCSAEIYDRFGRPNDLAILGDMPDPAIRVLHICGDNIGAERFVDYPVQILSWDDRGDGNPGMGELAAASGKAVMAGIPHKRIHRLPPEELADTVRASVGPLDRGFVPAGGCAVGAELDPTRLAAARALVDDWPNGR